MANEITVGFYTGATLTYGAYQPDGTVRTAAGTSLTEVAGTGYYKASDANIVAGDIVVVKQGTVVVAYGEYRPTVTTDISSLATQASVDVIDGIVDTILADTNELQTNQGNWVTATGISLVIPAGYVGDCIAGETIYFLWRTNKTPSAAGTIRVYRDNDDAEVSIPTGITDTRNFDSQTNVHLCIINLASNTFYSKESDYSVVLSGATINGETVNAVIASFSIENRYAGKEFIRQG